MGERANEEEEQGGQDKTQDTEGHASREGKVTAMGRAGRKAYTAKSEHKERSPSDQAPGHSLLCVGFDKSHAYSRSLRYSAGLGLFPLPSATKISQER